MSVTGAGGSPQVVTITFSQSEVTSKPAITVGSDQTCVSTPPAASDVLKTNGIASSNFNSATGTLTVTQAFTAHIPGSCTYVLVSAAGPQTASVNFTVDK